MPKRVVLLALLIVGLPLTGLANTVTFQNNGFCGNTYCYVTLQNTILGPVLRLTGSNLVGVTWLGGATITGKLGTVSFTTGPLISGTLAGGGTFGSGGSFVVNANGTGGLPAGLLFQGSFVNPTAWSATNIGVKPTKPVWLYTLSGNIVGGLSNGLGLAALTTQLTFDVSHNKTFNNIVRLNSGNSSGTIVPELGTLGLLGTGLLAIAGLLRRRLNS